MKYRWKKKRFLFFFISDFEAKSGWVKKKREWKGRSFFHWQFERRRVRRILWLFNGTRISFTHSLSLSFPLLMHLANWKSSIFPFDWMSFIYSRVILNLQLIFLNERIMRQINSGAITNCQFTFFYQIISAFIISAAYSFCSIIPHARREKSNAAALSSKIILSFFCEHACFETC